MRNVLIGIFAHPDDEAFGPSATLLKEVSEGAELHLLCLTNGEAGMNIDKHKDLGAVRLQEWRKAGEALGAKGLYPLGYPDGGLCHGMYKEIGDKANSIITTICRGADAFGNTSGESVSLRFITFDQNGITGHLDHIAASFLATKLFCCLKKSPPYNTTVKEIAYYCLSEKQAPANGDWSDFYSPMGRPASFINRRVDVHALLPHKFEIMKIHHTQRSDAAQHFAISKDILATDNYHVITA